MSRSRAKRWRRARLHAHRGPRHDEPGHGRAARDPRRLGDLRPQRGSHRQDDGGAGLRPDHRPQHGRTSCARPRGDRADHADPRAGRRRAPTSSSRPTSTRTARRRGRPAGCATAPPRGAHPSLVMGTRDGRRLRRARHLLGDRHDERLDAQRDARRHAAGPPRSLFDYTTNTVHRSDRACSHRRRHPVRRHPRRRRHEPARPPRPSTASCATPSLFAIGAAHDARADIAVRRRAG